MLLVAQHFSLYAKLTRQLLLLLSNILIAYHQLDIIHISKPFDILMK